ncbi:tripartite tricarboxylate transporter TctB family protein [Ancylobacter oerskovii]|uniref:Tripartite tricarboxylate transporter TctB family protein n=1 Tax=Ancylobacter oerskovii TaxID=459519 RepID=A0ABW4Z4T7_9HYPH|nr:tripartite tricarboxylate transporter TctB family protein [Ancylobacter oerskovii]MBS7542456.1 tripartite tricarboxylate transporter TctB family protein [Ancylobacter oerskovii]
MTDVARGALGSRKQAGAVSRKELGAAAILIALAVLGFALSSELPRGTLRSVGAGMLPQALSVLLGLCAIPILLGALRGAGEPGELTFSLRGPALVLSATALFALTIKSSHFEGWSTPELGLVVAGPLAIVIGGYASPEARLRPLVTLALFLTPFSLVLFGDLLNLPIPIMPRYVQEVLLAGWSYRGALRLAAALMAGAGVLVLLVGRRVSAKVPTATKGG